MRWINMKTDFIFYSTTSAIIRKADSGSVVITAHFSRPCSIALVRFSTINNPSWVLRTYFDEELFAHTRKESR